MGVCVVSRCVASPCVFRVARPVTPEVAGSSPTSASAAAALGQLLPIQHPRLVVVPPGRRRLPGLKVARAQANLPVCRDHEVELAVPRADEYVATLCVANVRFFHHGVRGRVERARRLACFKRRLSRRPSSPRSGFVAEIGFQRRELRGVPAAALFRRCAASQSEISRYRGSQPPRTLRPGHPRGCLSPALCSRRVPSSLLHGSRMVANRL